MAHDRKGRALD